MNNIITEIKNTLEGTSSRITEPEEWISKLEDRVMEITAEEENKEKLMKIIEDSLRNLRIITTTTKKNTQITGVPEEKTKRIRRYLRRL